MATKIFVYGTLKKGFSNHKVIGGSKFISNASINGTLYKFFGLPMAVLSSNDDIIKGEVYEVNDITLIAVNVLETGIYKPLAFNNKSIYKPIEVDTTLESGKVERTFMYIANVKSNLIPYGSNEYIKEEWV